MRLSNPFRPHARRIHPGYHRLKIEKLESREVLSAITWLNRGQASDNFDAAFATSPVSAETARQVVDTAILAWRRVIESFNHGDPGVAALPDELGMTISMVPGNNNCSAGVNPATVALSSEGKPYLATMLINMCDTNQDAMGNPAPDGIPDWFVDPTPNDHSEFMGTEVDTLNDGNEIDPGPLGNAMIPHAFAGVPQPGSAANGLFDFLTLVTHELGHAVGMTSKPASGFRTSPNITNTGIPDDATGGNNFWIYQSPTLNYLLSDRDGSSGNAEARHASLYRAGNTSLPGFSNVYGSRNLMNPNSISFDKRQLIPNHFVQMLQEIYGYTVNEPEQFGTFHAMLDPNTGVVTVRGGNDAVSLEGSTLINSPDIVSISRTIDELIVSVDVGNDMPGIGTGTAQFDQQDAYVSRFDISDVSSIVVDTYAGPDQINVFGLPSGITLSIDGGAGSDFITLGGFQLDSIDGTVTIVGGDDIDTLSFADPLEELPRTYTLNNTMFSRTGINPVSYSGIELINISGGQAADSYLVHSTPNDSLVTLSTGNGGDSIHISPLGDLDEIGGAVAVNGGSQGEDEADSLLIDDSLHLGAATYTISSGAVTRTGLPIFAFTYSGIESLEVDGGTSANTFDVNGTPSGLALTVTGGPSNDIFEVGNGDIDSNIGGDVSIVGGGNGGAGDVLILDDQFDDTGNDAYFFDDNDSFEHAFRKLNYVGELTYAGVERVRLDANSYDNNVHVLETDLFGNTALTISTGGGENTVFAGNGDFDSNVNGDLTVIGDLDDNPDALVILDQNDTGDDVYVFEGPTDTTGATFDKSGYNGVTSYTFLELVRLEASSFDNTVLLNGAGIGTAVTLNTRGGDDEIHVGVVDNGILEDVTGIVTVDGGTGVGDDVILHDQADTGDDSYDLDENNVVKSAFALDYANVESLTLNANPFDNVISVHRTGPSTPVIVNANNGADQILITPANQNLIEILSDVTVNGRGSADTLLVDDSNQSEAQVAEDPYTITATTVSRPNVGQINYATVGRVALRASDLDSTIDIVSTHPRTLVDVYGNRGQDRFNVNVPTLNSVTLFGGDDTDFADLTATDGDDEVHFSAGLGFAHVNVIGLEDGVFHGGGGTDVLVFAGVAGADEQVEVHASPSANQGAMSIVGAIDLLFEQTELIDLLANPGEMDTAAFIGTDQNNRFDIHLGATGTNADPVLQLLQPEGVSPLLAVRDYRNFGVLHIEGRDGADVFNVFVAPTGPGTGHRDLLVDGGPPSGPGNNTDELKVYWQGLTPPPPPPGPPPATGSPVDHDQTLDRFFVDYDPLHQFTIDYLNIEHAMSANASAAG